LVGRAGSTYFLWRAGRVRVETFFDGPGRQKIYPCTPLVLRPARFAQQIASARGTRERPVAGLIVERAQCEPSQRVTKSADDDDCPLSGHGALLRTTSDRSRSLPRADGRDDTRHDRTTADWPQVATLSALTGRERKRGSRELVVVESEAAGRNCSRRARSTFDAADSA
jgi:hypothetical protein